MPQKKINWERKSEPLIEWLIIRDQTNTSSDNKFATVNKGEEKNVMINNNNRKTAIGGQIKQVVYWIKETTGSTVYFLCFENLKFEISDLTGKD